MTKRALTLTSLVALVVAASAVAQVAPDGGSRASAECAPCSLRSSPAGPLFVVNGRGWGHGIGLAQYGANGFAKRGSTYPQILAHYYPGTRLSSANVARVRVLLRDGATRLQLASKAEFHVDDASGESYELSAGSLALGSGLKVKVDPAKPPKTLRGPLTFRPGASSLKLGDRSYRGRIEVSVVDGKLRAINDVGLEAYLFGVVPSEMPHHWHAEALKAQAVVARSYALTHRRSGPFDLYPDQRSQVYLGIDHEKPSTTAAVRATARKVVSYRGKIAETFFFSSSGGRTATITDVWPTAKPLPYLVSIDDPYDVDSPYHRWGPLVYSATSLARTLRAPGRLLDVQATPNASGRVSTLVAIGAKGNREVDGNGVRRALGLRSTYFSVGVLSLPKPSGPAVVFGSRVTLTGVARGVGPTSLQRRAAGEERWAAVRAVKPKPDGTFSVTDKPSISAQYRLAISGAATAAVDVAVAPLVRLRATADGTGLRGVVRPLAPGAPVVIQRLVQGRWPTVARATVTASGEFETTLRLSAGTYRARTPARNGFAAGVSPPLVVQSP